MNSSSRNSPSTLKKLLSSPNTCNFSLRLAGLTEKSCRTCSPSQTAPAPYPVHKWLHESVVTVEHQAEEFQASTQGELHPTLSTIPFQHSPEQPRAAQGRDWTQHRLRLQLRSDLSFRQYQHIKHIKERPLERRLPRQQCVLALCKAQNKVVPCKQKFIHTPSSLLPPGTPWEKPKLLLSLTHWSSGFLNLGTVWRFCSCLHRTWDWRRLLRTPKALFSQMSTTKSCTWTTDWHIPQDCPHWNVHSHNTIPEKQPKPRKLKFSVVMKTQARNCNALRHLYPAAIKRTQNELCEWFHAFNVQTKCLHLSWQVSLLGCRMNGKIYKHLRLYFPNCSEQPSHRL